MPPLLMSGTTMEEAACRRSSRSCSMVSWMALLAESENCLAASPRSLPSRRKWMGRVPAGVIRLVSPTNSTGRESSRLPSEFTGVSWRRVPIFWSVKISSR